MIARSAVAQLAELTRPGTPFLPRVSERDLLMPPQPADGTLDRCDVWTPVCRISTPVLWLSFTTERTIDIAHTGAAPALQPLARRARDRIWDPECDASLPVQIQEVALVAGGYRYVESLTLRIRPTEPQIAVSRQGRYADESDIRADSWAQFRLRFCFNSINFGSGLRSGIYAQVREVWLFPSTDMRNPPPAFWAPREIR